MAADPDGVPHALLHNMKHNKVLHERVIVITVKIEDVPYVDAQQHVEVHDLGQNFWRIILHYGFMQEIDVPADLEEVGQCGPAIKAMETSFFLGRPDPDPLEPPGHGAVARKTVRLDGPELGKRDGFFKLPTNRVIELGSQVEI